MVYGLPVLAKQTPSRLSMATSNVGNDGSFTGEQKDHWEACLEYAQNRARRDVDAFKGEIANLLLIAALISAAVSPFAVESYHNVKQDPAERTVRLLQSLVALQSNTTNPQANMPIDLDPVVPISAAARRTNIYNIVSLLLSLIVVVVGIVCLQWLREYGRDPSAFPVSHSKRLRVCHMRLKGMKEWGAFGLLELLPIIFLLSLLLFFAGIVELLWEVDSRAAIIALAVILLACSFLVITTVSPALHIALAPASWLINLSPCPYRSFQAWIVYRVTTTVVNFISWVINFVLCRKSKPSAVLHRSLLRDWVQFDQWFSQNMDQNIPAQIPQDFNEAARLDRKARGFNETSPVHWLGSMYLHEERFADALPKCLWESAMWDRRYIPSLCAALPLRWVKPLQSARRWGQTQVGDLAEAHLCDVAVFQALACLVEENRSHQASPVLIRKRWELFVMICETRVDADIECPLLRKIDDDTVIPGDLRKRALECIYKAMQSARQNAQQGIQQNAQQNDLQNDLQDVHRVNQTRLKAIGEILRIESQALRPRLKLFRKARENITPWTTTGPGIPQADSAFAQSVLRRIRDLKQLASSEQWGGAGREVEQDVGDPA